jgi:hypothetical protein
MACDTWQSSKVSRTTELDLVAAEQGLQDRKLSVATVCNRRGSVLMTVRPMHN